MVARALLLFCCSVFYITVFVHVDRTMQNRSPELQAAPPLQLLRATSGYLKQITAEILFVRTNVFLGSIQSDVLENEANLAQNLETMTSLYPEFIDPYFYTESFLAPVSEFGTEKANIILKTGINTYPDNFVLRFFYAFNYYRFLNKPLLAAEAFKEGAAIDGAPDMFGHLAALLSAEGGELTAGMIMLQMLIRAEENDSVKQQYVEELEYFEEAIVVEKAIAAYMKEHNAPPEHLEDLVPDYLVAIPIIKERFVLVYEPPNVLLKRP